MGADTQPRIAAIVPMGHFSRRVAGKNYRVLDIDTEVDWEVARARLAVADKLPA